LEIAALVKVDVLARPQAVAMRGDLVTFHYEVDDFHPEVGATIPERDPSTAAQPRQARHRLHHPAHRDCPG